MHELDASTLTRAFDELPMGVVVLDADARVVFYNQYEEKLAGRNRADVLGQNFFRSVAPCTRVTGLGEAFAAKIGREQFHVELDFHFPRAHVPHPCDVHLELLSVAIDGDPHGALLIQDVSSIRAVERTKDLLTRLLSHDMRSPLTAAIGNTDLALLDLENPESLRGYLQDTQLALHRVRGMLEDLHDVTHLNTRTLPRDFVTFDLAALAQTLVAEKRSATDHSNAPVEIEGASEPLLCRGNPRLVGRALDNLMQNALIHGAGKSVRVRLARDSDHVTIEVEDRGPGIPDAIAPRLFEPGTSVPLSTDDSGHHRGLGLALVRLVCDHHDGVVEHHTPEAGGARFRMVLPIRDA